jgi:hypothetical protein
MIKVVFLVTSTVEAANGRTFVKGKAYWLRPDQYAFWDARGRIGPAPADMPTENAPFSVVRAGRETFDVVGPSNRRLNTAAMPWADAEALRAAAEADWLVKGRAPSVAAVETPAPVQEPPQPVVAAVETPAAVAITEVAVSPQDRIVEIDAVADLSVAKGPGGRFFVKRGDANVSRGFATEEEAEAAKAGIAANQA